MSADAQRRYRARNPEAVREAAARYRAKRRARAADAEAAREAAAREATHGALAPVIELLEARERSLALPAGSRTIAGYAARHRRAEVRDLIAALTEWGNA